MQFYNNNVTMYLPCLCYCQCSYNKDQNSAIVLTVLLCNQAYAFVYSYIGVLIRVPLVGVISTHV